MRIEDALLTKCPNTRPGIIMPEILAVIFHWVANAKTTAKQNRGYFEGLKSNPSKFDSIHYIVGLDGEVLRLIRDEEKAFHCGTLQADPKTNQAYTPWARELFGRFAADPQNTSPNNCTIGVEMCHTDDDGNMTEETIESAINLGVDLCQAHSLAPLRQIGTHHLVVGWKDCPRLWTRNPELLDAFRTEVNRRMG
jgi:N-acetylmuramoyl-L-alanine amidase